MTDEQIKVFDDLQTDLIGPEEEATLDPPTQDENGVLRGGTCFERTGVVGINGTCCYLMASTTQHSVCICLKQGEFNFNMHKQFDCVHGETVCICNKVSSTSTCTNSLTMFAVNLFVFV